MLWVLIFNCFLIFFAAIHAYVVCFLICLCTLVAYIANTMNPDQTAPLGAVWSGFVVFAFKNKIILECIWI